VIATARIDLTCAADVKAVVVPGDLRIADLDGHGRSACAERADPVAEIAGHLRGGHRDRDRRTARVRAYAVPLIIDKGAFGNVDVDAGCAAGAVNEDTVQVMLKPGIADMHVGGAARLRPDLNAGGAIVVEDRVGDMELRGAGGLEKHSGIAAQTVAD